MKSTENEEKMWICSIFLENKITAYMDEVNGTQYRLPVTDDQIV